jgi:hypothetical protein
MQAGDEAIDHGLGDQIEAGDGGEDGRTKEALFHGGAIRCQMSAISVSDSDLCNVKRNIGRILPVGLRELRL